jgi:hypothetical protein
MPSIGEAEFYEDAVAELLREAEVLDRPVAFEEEDGVAVAKARVITYKTGLRHLDSIYDQREAVEQKKPDGFMRGAGGGFFAESGDEPEELRVVLQPLEFLMNAARELDRAASDLDLLAETGASEPKPFMSDFDASKNGHAKANLTQADVGGSPDI